MEIVKGHFYYITNQYFNTFNDKNLMSNKEETDGQLHNRPCFYAFKDDNSGLFWMIPISSQVDKYKKHYQKKIEKHGRCDTIVFGKVLGKCKVFLIQNMCPITQKYVLNEYLKISDSTAVKISNELEYEIESKAKKILSLQRNGKRYIFPDVLKIEEELLQNRE